MSTPAVVPNLTPAAIDALLAAEFGESPAKTTPGAVQAAEGAGVLNSLLGSEFGAAGMPSSPTNTSSPTNAPPSTHTTPRRNPARSVRSPAARIAAPRRAHALAGHADRGASTSDDGTHVRRPRQPRPPARRAPAGRVVGTDRRPPSTGPRRDPTGGHATGPGGSPGHVPSHPWFGWSPSPTTGGVAAPATRRGPGGPGRRPVGRCPGTPRFPPVAPRRGHRQPGTVRLARNGGP